MTVTVLLLSLGEIHQRADSPPWVLSGITKFSRSHRGMILAHVGVAMTVWGIAFSQNYSIERDVRMNVGDSVEIAGYQFKFNGVHENRGPNYTGGAATVDITRNGKRKPHH